MRKPSKVFEVVRWHYDVLAMLESCLELTQYASDTKAIHYHLSRRKEITLTHASFREGKRGEMRRKFRDLKVQGIGQASRIYFGQMLVVSYALVETVTKDFFCMIFMQNPDWMNEYLASDATGQKGLVKLTDITSSNSLRSFYASMAKQAASKAVRGSIRDIFKRIERLTGHTVPADLTQKLADLQDRRNAIAHHLEGLKDIEGKDAEAAFDLVLIFLRQLGHAALKAGVKLDDPDYPKRYRAAPNTYEAPGCQVADVRQRGRGNAS